MGSTTHVEEDQRELAKDLHRHAHQTYGFHKRGNSGDEWGQQDQDPILLELKTNVHKKKILAFE